MLTFHLKGIYLFLEDKTRGGEEERGEEGSCREGGIEEEEEVKVWIRKQLLPLPRAACSSRKAPISRKITSLFGFNSSWMTETPPEHWTDRHALPGALCVFAGRVLCAVAVCGPGGVLRVGADPAVPVHAVEHDQNAEPPPPQHAGQRGAGHRAVWRAAGWVFCQSVH